MRALEIKEGKRVCSRCHEEKPVEAFPKRGDVKHGTKTTCKKCLRAYMAAWRAKNPEANSFWYRAKLGVTPAVFNEMLAKQGGVCAICLSVPKKKFRGDTFHVDHDHATGKVRGLLCCHCNRLLGCAKDNKATLASAITYLNKQVN